MASQDRLDAVYLKMAVEWGKLSTAERKKVGCLVVKDNQIISDGFNGTPAGFDNTCEDEEGKTKKEVLHAESNALMKLARGTQSCEGATLYTTLSPCFDCAKLIVQSGISKVICKKRYRIEDGISFLESCGVQVIITD